MSLHQVTLSFNGGEVTPYLAHLNTFSKHASSAGRMENFLPMPFGGFRKRPGTVHLGYVTRGDGLDNPTSEAAPEADFKALNGYPRLETFNFSATEQYLMVFTRKRLNIYKPDGVLVKSFPDLPEDVTPDEKARLEGLAEFSDPFLLQFAQVNDIVFIADPGKPPRRLCRMVGDWELIDVPFTQPPLLDENDDESMKIITTFGDNSADPWAANTNYAIGQAVTHGGKRWVANYAHKSKTLTDTLYGPPGTGTYPWPVPHTWLYVLIYRQVNRPLWTMVRAEPKDTSSVVGQTVNLESTFELFEENMIGSVMRISKERSLKSFEVSLDAAPSGQTKGPSEVLVVQGGWNFTTFGTWCGTFYLEVSRDHGKTWKDVRSFSADGDRNINATGEEPDRVLMRIRSEHSGSNEHQHDPRGVLSATDAHISGIVRIETVAEDKLSATATCLTPVEKTGTDGTQFWSLGAFSKAQGYPAAIGVHERRLVFGGTKSKPLSLWMSATDDLLNFRTGTEDDDGIHLTLASAQQDPIRWIASQRRLYIGTAGGEWVFGSENSDNPVSPTNLAAREHTSYGSAQLPALRINDGIFFVERQGRRLREFAYVIDRESYGAADLTRLAEHLTEGGITQLAWQANREPFLWAVTAKGMLLSFAYHRGEEIAAWARHNTADGKIRSVAVLRNETGDDDVFLLVERFAEKNTYKYGAVPPDPGIPKKDKTATYLAIEKLSSSQQAIQEAGDLGAVHHVDGGLSIRVPEKNALGVPVPPITSVTLPRHLIGKQLTVVADGVYDTDYKPGEDPPVGAPPGTPPVMKTTVTLDRPARDVHVGARVVSTLTTLPQDIDVENGPTHSRLKRAHEMKLNVFNSFGGSYTYDGKTLHIDYTNTADSLDAAPLMRNGWISHTLEPAHVEDLTFSIVHDEPYPFLVRASILSWSLHEP